MTLIEGTPRELYQRLRKEAGEPNLPLLKIRLHLQQRNLLLTTVSHLVDQKYDKYGLVTLFLSNRLLILCNQITNAKSFYSLDIHYQIDYRSSFIMSHLEDSCPLERLS